MALWLYTFLSTFVQLIICMSCVVPFRPRFQSTPSLTDFSKRLTMLQMLQMFSLINTLNRLLPLSAASSRGSLNCAGAIFSSAQQPWASPLELSNHNEQHVAFASRSRHPLLRLQRLSLIFIISENALTIGEVGRVK